MNRIGKSAMILLLAIGLLVPPGAAGAEGWFARGLSLLRDGQYPEALSAFNKAIEENPRQANAYNGRGAVWHKMGSHEQAIADYSRALELDPDYANAYNNRGVAWYQRGECRRAVEDYSQALTINPGYVNSLSNRGAAHKKLGEYEEAIADFTRAIAIRPTYEACNLLAWTLATCPDLKYRNGELAVELAIKAADMRMEPRSLGTLAAAFAEAGRFDEAVETQIRVLDLMRESGRTTSLDEPEARLETYRSNRALGREPPVKKTEVAAAASTVVSTRERAEKIERTDSGPVTGERESEEKTDRAGTEPLVAPKAVVASRLPYTIQISSFRDRKTAFRIGKKYRDRGDTAFFSLIHIPSKGGDWFRLFIGLYETVESAEQAAEVLKQRKFRHIRVIKKSYAVEIETGDAGRTMEQTMQDLLQKQYLPYRLPSASAGAGGRERLFIGAFESEKAAAPQVEKLRNDGFSPRIVKR